jgi:acyl-CoA hydrolase
MLLVATAYLAAANWYESPEALKLLDRVKRHLPVRLQDILNRHLAPRVE